MTDNEKAKNHLYDNIDNNSEQEFTEEDLKV
jgi:hypothetical protein